MVKVKLNYLILVSWLLFVLIMYRKSCTQKWFIYFLTIDTQYYYGYWLLSLLARLCLCLRVPCIKVVQWKIPVSRQRITYRPDHRILQFATRVFLNLVYRKIFLFESLCGIENRTTFGQLFYTHKNMNNTTSRYNIPFHCWFLCLYGNNGRNYVYKRHFYGWLIMLERASCRFLLGDFSSTALQH